MALFRVATHDAEDGRTSRDLSPLLVYRPPLSQLSFFCPMIFMNFIDLNLSDQIDQNKSLLDLTVSSFTFRTIHHVDLAELRAFVSTW